MRKFAVVVILLIIGAGVGVIAFLSLPVTYSFRLEASFTFDGKPYTAIGYMRCRFQRAWLQPFSDPYRLGQPIYEGYYTTTWRDAPSVVLPDGKGAIIIPRSGSCPPLPVLRREFLGKQAADLGGSWPAYYFPDRGNPKLIWIFADRARTATSDGRRYFLKNYLFVQTDGEPVASLQKNVPAAWRWYEQFSEQYRKGMRSVEGFKQKLEDVWFGLNACLMYEDEWSNKPEFVRAARGRTTLTIVATSELANYSAWPCPGQRTRNIALIPSADYSEATLDPGRRDLHWTTITTPPQDHDKQHNRWLPTICLAGDGCVTSRNPGDYWLYSPKERLFALIEQPGLETFRFTDFAVRPGDDL